MIHMIHEMIWYHCISEFSQLTEDNTFDLKFGYVFSDPIRKTTWFDPVPWGKTSQKGVSLTQLHKPHQPSTINQIKTFGKSELFEVVPKETCRLHVDTLVSKHRACMLRKVRCGWRLGFIGHRELSFKPMAPKTMLKFSCEWSVTCEQTKIVLRLNDQ